MRQAGAMARFILPGGLTDLQWNSQPPVPSVSKCAHFQLADLHEEQLGRVCAVLRELLRSAQMGLHCLSLGPGLITKAAHEIATMCNNLITSSLKTIHEVNAVFSTC